MLQYSHIINLGYRKGRGAQINPKNKFLAGSYSQAEVQGIDDWELNKVETTYIYEDAKTIVNKITSSDIPITYSANPYQGCEHGCIYCYARNSHEYWGYGAGTDFESKIVVKRNAPQLLKQCFENKNWQPASICISGNTDCYQPIERRMKLTRAMLEVCLDFRNPVGIITKNSLILRDLDILKEMAKYNLITVYSSITSLNEPLRRLLEPRTASYAARLNTLKTLADNGIPVGVMNAPIIPGLTDSDMFDVLNAAKYAGAQWAGYTIVRLNGAIGEIFKDWLYKNMPDRADKVWNQISSCHAGQVNDSQFGRRMKGEGVFADMIGKQFQIYCKKLNLNRDKLVLNTADFRRVRNNQLPLF